VGGGGGARRFTAEARIVTHLLQRGVPVAVPVLSNDGKAYTTDDDGALHAVFPMLPPAAALAEVSARVQPRWKSIVQALSAAPQRIHGDVHGGNILTDGQQVTGIIDIDHLPLAPRGYDLGYYAAFAVRWWLEAGQPERSLDETRHLLGGYHAVSPLTGQESNDLPALALAAALGLINHFLTERDLAEESWRGAAHWIGDNFDALRFPASALES
jgi:Ser/Thr protein kinase RdoA (MazF antagonist)